MERFWSKVLVGDESECWPWLASQRSGYGAMYFGGRMRGAHCVAYELCVGEVAPGVDIHHDCGNRLCCNPRHLVALARSDHGRMHALTQPPRPKPTGPCRRCGKPLADRPSGGRTYRRCLPCDAARKRRERARRSDAKS